MREPAASLAGFFRILYFLAAAIITITVVVTGVTSFYEPPDGGDEFRFEGFEGDSGFVLQGNDERADYNRNLGLIFGLVGTAFMATAILGLGSRFNPLRAGLLIAGLALFNIGTGFGASGSDDWLTFLVSAIAFVVVVGSVLWVDEGLPMGGAGPPRRVLDIGPPPSEQPGA